MITKLNFKKSLIAVSLTTICLSLMMSSCSAPKSSVRVRNNADGTSTNISVRNGEGASTTVSVSTPVSLDSLSFDFSKSR